MCRYLPVCYSCDVYYETVKLDSGYPSASLLVSFEDCADTTCDPSPAVKLLFTSTNVGDCGTTNCCGDFCSGPAAWNLVFEESVCGAGCDPVTETGCPIAGDTGCDCLLYADSGEVVTYNGTFTFEDNVGWKVTSAWVVVVDTDSVVSFDATGIAQVSDPAYNTATDKTNTIPVNLGAPSDDFTWCDLPL